MQGLNDEIRRLNDQIRRFNDQIRRYLHEICALEVSALQEEPEAAYEYFV